MTSIHRLILMAFLGFAAVAQASDLAPPTLAEARDLLTQDRYEELEQRFGAVQRAYRDGKIDDVELRAAFRALYLREPELDEHYRAWVAHSPKNYVAHLARAIHYKWVGLDSRGEKFASETTKEQFDGMHAAYEIALEEFRLSESLEKKPILTYLHALDVVRGDREVARLLLKSAIKIDRDNFIVREKFMGTLQTRWGGSVEQMRKFLVACHSAGLSADQLKSLESYVHEDEAWVHQFREGDLAAALRSYKLAATLAAANEPARKDKYLELTYRAARLSMETGDYQGAVDLYTKLLADNPGDIAALNERGFSYDRLGDQVRAAADTRKAAELGNAHAQFNLGVMLISYNYKGVPGDYVAGKKLIEKAAAQNYPHAIEWLKQTAEAQAEQSKRFNP
jgi:tetratricopeptide (TPR) repeat protein